MERTTTTTIFIALTTDRRPTFLAVARRFIETVAEGYSGYGGYGGYGYGGYGYGGYGGYGYSPACYSYFPSYGSYYQYYGSPNFGYQPICSYSTNGIYNGGLVGTASGYPIMNTSLYGNGLFNGGLLNGTYSSVNAYYANPNLANPLQPPPVSRRARDKRLLSGPTLAQIGGQNSPNQPPPNAPPAGTTPLSGTTPTGTSNPTFTGIEFFCHARGSRFSGGKIQRGDACL